MVEADDTTSIWFKALTVCFLAFLGYATSAWLYEVAADPVILDKLPESAPVLAAAARSALFLLWAAVITTALVICVAPTDRGVIVFLTAFVTAMSVALAYGFWSIATSREHEQNADVIDLFLSFAYLTIRGSMYVWVLFMFVSLIISLGLKFRSPSVDHEVSIATPRAKET